MTTGVIEKKFDSIGARVKIHEFDRNITDATPSLIIDIKKDRRGQYFDIGLNPIADVDLKVIDIQKKKKHLVLMSSSERQHGRKTISKYLCGHDEREWFTCAVQESSHRKAVSTVFDAMQALKPKDLISIEQREGVRKKDLHKRHRRLKSGGKIYRQGEFMFIPIADFKPPESSLTVIHQNEPMQRGRRSKPHMAEFLYRIGGTQVWVSGYSSRSRGVGYTQKEYEDLIERNPDAARYRWNMMSREPTVYVKGRISHSDHATIDLKNVWHKVMLNTEILSSSVAFLD